MYSKKIALAARVDEVGLRLEAGGPGHCSSWEHFIRLVVALDRVVKMEIEEEKI